MLTGAPGTCERRRRHPKPQPSPDGIALGVSPANYLDRMQHGRAHLHDRSDPRARPVPPVASIRSVATNNGSYSEQESFLLELLYFAGWQLQIRRGQSTRIRATPGGVE